MIQALFDVSGAEWISQENSDYRVRLEISCITLLARLIHLILQGICQACQAVHRESGRWGEHECGSGFRRFHQFDG